MDTSPSPTPPSVAESETASQTPPAGTPATKKRKAKTTEGDTPAKDIDGKLDKILSTLGQLQFDVESLKKEHDRLVEAVDGLTSWVEVIEKGFGARIETLERTVFTHSTAPETAMEIDGTTTVHKVHFPESLDAFGHDSSILVQPLNDVHINVHLGFIQVNHRYEVRFQFDSPPHLGSLSVRTQDPPNLNLRVLELKPVISSAYWGTSAAAFFLCATLSMQGPGMKSFWNCLPIKRNYFENSFMLQSCNNPLLTLTLMLNARVLGKGKGTPFLKTGIHCIGIEMEEESDQSDWQGFD
ncbi:hypothetical protein HPB49_009311 [Dermacentor silvarum]|uniref:Uncharacterized protein n=1 Tax=Dermacentor silvarum TaxID=543639 RepID=A0ACB8DYP6_DERSI|nr:hypothetical protein HPB49_009311 [Dermacentor silvarum]